MKDDQEKQTTTSNSPDPQPICRQNSVYRPGRGANSECCSRCCCSCLRLLFLILVVAIVLTGLAITISCIIINPHQMKFHVAHAAFTKFDYVSAKKTLHFKLTLNVTIRNPNKRIGIHSDSSTDTNICAYYDDKFLGVGLSNLLSLYLPPGASSPFDYSWVSFEGMKTVSFDSGEMKRFNRRKSDGIFPLFIKVKMVNSFKVDQMHIGDFRSTVKCRLKIPLVNGTNNSNNNRFKATECVYHLNPFPIIYTE
ncbi:hypothetical protein G4B88_010256 [Cannabis sativa]|uniref:Late embryogenesis abundant protein LEA-2 subgroup domain-containing protein n=1 Tax=Cannabis sativa TaxID=3483 RepID=A0A7J6I5D3_CANSA|nr:hypothetical protein G4B88_010256 [Cannabis sativa]